jgi:hypothetical protein
MKDSSMRNKHVLIIFILISVQIPDAQTLQAYRIRTDQESYFRIDDNRETPFWNEWSNRETFDTTIQRLNRDGSIDDGKVKLSCKIAFSNEFLYLNLHLKYEKTAPSAQNLFIPVDKIRISFAGCALSSIPADVSYFKYNSISTYLTKESISMQYMFKLSSILSANSWATSPFPCFETFCSEVVLNDSLNRAIETKIPLSALFQTEPKAKFITGIDLRYYPFPDNMASMSFPFEPEDTTRIGGRIFLGNLRIDDNINDTSFVITFPKYSDILTGGENYTITWGSTVKGGLIGIDYSSNNGATWQNVTFSTSNDDSYPWKVPLIPSKKYKVRLLLNDKITAISDSFLVVFPVPKLLSTPDTISDLSLKWDRVSAASSYLVVIDTSILFTSPLIVDSTNVQCYSNKKILPNRTTFWKVSSNLDYSSFSEIDSFYYNNNNTSLVPKTHGNQPIVDLSTILKNDYASVTIFDISGKNVKTIYLQAAPSNLKLITTSYMKDLSIGSYILLINSVKGRNHFRVTLCH